MTSTRKSDHRIYQHDLRLYLRNPKDPDAPILTEEDWEAAKQLGNDLRALITVNQREAEIIAQLHAAGYTDDMIESAKALLRGHMTS